MKMEKEQYERFESGFIPQEKILSILGIWPSNVNDLVPFTRFLFAMVINVSFTFDHVNLEESTRSSHGILSVIRSVISTVYPWSSIGNASALMK